MENIIPKAWESILSSAAYTPVIVKSIERVEDTSWSSIPNRHEFFEMVYIKKGDAVFEISGVQVEVGPNDIIIIKPEQIHQLTVKSKLSCEYIVLSFKFVNRFEAQYSGVPLEDFLNFVSSKESGSFIQLKVSQKNEIITLLNRILKERENPDIGSELLNYLLVMELFVLISRALKMEWENSIKNKSPKLKELIEVARNYILNNYERDISLKDVSQHVFLSTSYFTKAFKDEVGISPINYLLKVRIERAKELLRDTNNKISDIALSVGFSNQQRFNDIFKKYARMTPLQYRRETS